MVHIKNILVHLLEEIHLVHIPGKRGFCVPSAHSYTGAHRSQLGVHEQVNKLTGTLEDVHLKGIHEQVHTADIEWTGKGPYSKPVIEGREEALRDIEIQLINRHNRTSKARLDLVKAAAIKKLWARGYTIEEISDIKGSGYSKQTVAKYTPLFSRGRGQSVKAVN